MSQRQSDMEKELKALRAQVEALTQAQAEAAAEAGTASDDLEAEIEGPAAADASHATLDFQELFDLLKHEVEDMNPLTAIAIFGLGVLTGRLLSR